MTLEYLAECNPKSPDNIWNPARFAVVDQTAPGGSLLASGNNVTSCVLSYIFLIMWPPDARERQLDSEHLPKYAIVSFTTLRNAVWGSLNFQWSFNFNVRRPMRKYVTFYWSWVTFFRRTPSLNRAMSRKGHRATPVKRRSEVWIIFTFAYCKALNVLCSLG